MEQMLYNMEKESYNLLYNVLDDDQFNDYDVSISSMEEVVSKIIFDSCFPKLPKDLNIYIHLRSFAINCGSMAEFYIEPIQTCIDDRDVLVYGPNEFAFSGNAPLPPADVRKFNEEFKCLRLEPYKKYPGFVRMKYAGEMKYNWDLNKYDFHKARETTQYFAKTNQQVISDHLSKKYRCKFEQQIKGPAFKYITESKTDDHVLTVCCPRWPDEAKDWLYRRRNNGWPTKANLHMIANKGCHVVFAKHRDCRDDDFQCRFSFSLAEVVLLRSWTKTQQLVYHMLRFFAKKELIKKHCPKEKEVLCTYHLKTLMLWACEQESSEWWNSSVIKLCSKLLQKLSDWLQRRHCPNYFIPEANLFHDQFDADNFQAVVECIRSLNDPKILSQWFLDKYLLPFFFQKDFKDHEGSDGTFAGRLFYKMRDSMALEASHDGSLTMLCKVARVFIVTKAFEFRYLNGNDFVAFITRYSHDLNEQRMIQQKPHHTSEWEEDSFVCCGLPMNSENSVIICEPCAYTLTATTAIMRKDVFCYKTFLSDMSIILSHRFRSYWVKCNNFPYEYKTRFDKRYVYFLRAQEHMSDMTASVGDPEFQLLSRLSMEFLIKSVTSNEATSKDVRSAAFAYMASICYVTSQYQTAIELCSESLTNSEPFGSSRPSPSSKREPLSGGCLLFIDDVSMIIGYLFLWKHVLDRLLDRYSEIDLDLRLSPEVCAQYIIFQSMQRLSQPLPVNWNKIPGEFLIDALLIAVMKRKLDEVRNEAKSCLHGYKLCIYRRNRSDSELINLVTGFLLSEENSIRLLMECSLNKMTLLCKDFSKDFTFCYRLMYHYRCRHYDEVMNLCEQILHEAAIDVEQENYLSSDVMVVPPFSSFFDEEMQCLIGLQTLCFVLFPSYSDSIFNTNSLRNPDSLRLHKSQQHLMRIVDNIFHYYLKKHFLARYLQLRCLFDNNSSLSEKLTAFGKLKCRLRFEYFVREFLRQKLKKTVKHFE